MKKSLFLSCILFLLSYSVEAQISFYGIPVSFTDTNCLPQSNVQSIVLPLINNDSLLQADSIYQVNNDSTKGFNFAIPVKMNYGLTNSGTWEMLPDSSRLWRLHLTSQGSYTSFLVFDKFFMPKGSKLFAYNEDRSQVLGAFTEKNNKPYGRFSLGPIRGEAIILEYIEPANTDTTAEINVTAFIHTFKDHVLNFDGTQPAFGLSGECNINVLCSLGDGWCNQRRSVALYATLNAQGHFVRACTGALITNERRDSRPYFLTADHCVKGPVTDWWFIFNYQSPACADPIDPPATTFSISGATLRANHSFSDFALLELTVRPPGNFNTYYAGWDNRDNKPGKNGRGIHHPEGDIKKISRYKNKPKRRTKFWKVKKWAEGTTEFGSSGSPLFSPDKLVVGQLQGGDAACDGNDPNNESDFYGRFDKSWDKKSGSLNQLKPWLNPHGTNSAEILAMSGDEPCKVSYNFTNANDLHTSANIDGLNNPSSAGTRTYNGVYEVTDQITAGTNVTIQVGDSVTFDAGNLIRLTPGFRAPTGSTFRAIIGGCLRGCNTGVGKMGETEDPAIFVLSTDTINEVEDEQESTFNNNELNDNIPPNKDAFTIYPNPNTGMFTLNIKKVMEAEDIHIKIINTFGQEIYYEKLSQFKGTYNKQIDLSTYSKGIYNLQLLNSKGIRNKKIIKL